MKYYLAIDIGASSGRHIVGWKEQGLIKTEEVYRFPNCVDRKNGHLIWDVDNLFIHVTEGIDKAIDRYGQIESLAIDTWGVDYVLIKDDTALLPCFSYRDLRTQDLVSRVHNKIPFEQLYERTGIQFQPFNTIYQLYADMEEGRLSGVTDFLMMPEYLTYRLCGTKAHEYTNATTTGIVNARNGQYDMDIVRMLGLPEHLFNKLNMPGDVIGEYRGIQCRLCASHDTASAVEGIPMEENAPYISSGTWSLLGVKTGKAVITTASMKSNWSNEGGVGYNRYQKNIMGMWIVNRLRDELNPMMPWDEIIDNANVSRFDETVDINDDIFLSPESMKAAFDSMLSKGADFAGDYYRCAYRSLALSYKNNIDELEHNLNETYDKLYIVGGGAKNSFLNTLTENITGKDVIALPIEATALGNLRIQMEE
ncbi:MAG TPA: rhamnulokinase [Lachnospiraceae bacterium]|nr:rhamnulokinase [Lachnospiraceae bacterium]